MRALKADEDIGNLEEEEAAITEEIAEVLQRRQKDKLPVLRDIPKKKFLEDTAKIDKILCNFRTHSIRKTNELLYAGVLVFTNRLGVKINNAKETRNLCGEGGYKIKLKN